VLREVREQLKRALTEARYLPKTIGLAQAASGRWMPIWLLLLLVQGLLPAFAVFLTKDIVDGLLTAIQSHSGWSAARPLLRPSILLAIITATLALVRGAATWLRNLQAELLQDHISHLIHAKSVAVSITFYDFPEFFDHLHRARDEARYRPVQLLESLGGLLQNGVTFIAVAAMLMTYGIWLPTLLLVSALPSLVVVLRNALRRRASKARTTPLERKAWYYDDILTGRETAAEVRMFDLGRHYSGAFQSIRCLLRAEQLVVVRREAIGELAAVSMGMCGLAAVAAWGITQAMRGLITAGALGMFYAALVQGQSVMRSLLMDAGMVYTNSLFLRNLFAFLALEPEAAQRKKSTAPALARVRRGIRFESVDFKYPGASRHALSGFCLDIPAGQTIALVGANGAGKTTVMKLLCRLYEPERGAMFLDGVDIREWTPADFRRSVSVLFQDPVRYAAKVHENIALGDLSHEPGRARVEMAARAAGAASVVSGFPQGYDTLLGKSFESGVELSGGEWQRIALARALLKPSPILLLDEPTSAMDSWAEIEWFDRLRQATAGRTIVIITHRFTTAMRADVIHVMEQGRIVESGSHEDLLALGGRYAYSWRRQTAEPVLT
jgi:ATP-binding cassette subfamily B protein